MKQKVSKILSLICALALIVSCVSVGFVVSAEVVFEGSASFSVPTGTNHFASSKLTIAETDGTDWNIANNANLLSATLTTLTDGSVGSSTHSKAFKVASGSSSSLLNADNNSLFTASNRTGTVAQQTAAFMQVTFDLKGTVDNPEKFYYAGHYSSAAKLISAHYSIFASDTLYDLYDAKNSLYTRIEVPEDGTEVTAGYTQGYRQNTIDISSLNLTNVKYFGIRYYHRDNANYMVDASEVGLYGGTYTASNVVYTESMEAPAEDATYSTDNHLKDNGTITYMVNGEVSGTGSMAATYYDGLPTSGYSEGAAFGFTSANNSPFQDDTYMQYEYTLDNAINNPESFFFAQGSAYTDRASQRWTLFASSDKASLYNDESIVYEYLSNYGGTSSAYNAQPTEQTLDISDLSLQNIKYVAIRFYHRSHAINYADGGQMLFISELGLYGGEVVETVTPTVNLYLGTPVLTDDNIKIEVFMSGNNAEMCAVNYKVYSEQKLTPVTTESGTVVDSYSDGTEITFNAQGTKFENPEDFDGYTGFQILNESYCDASSTAGIKTAEGKIAEVYFAAPDMPGTYTFKIVGISGAAFIENATDVQDYVITVGEDVTYTYAPTASLSTEQIKYTNDTDYDTYGVNYLKYGYGEGLATDGTTDMVLTVGAGSTDGRIASANGTSVNAGKNNGIVTEGNNATNQTAAYLQMEYTLNGVINNPEKIVFISHLSNGNLTSQHYAVFASSSIDTLYDEAIYEFTLAENETVANTHIIDISKLKLQNIKYVAIRFYHRAYTNAPYAQHVEEFGIFGGEYSEETLDNLTVNSDLTADYEEANGKNLLVYSQFTSSSSSDIAYSTKPDFSVLTDGSVAVGNSIQPDSGRIGKSGNMLQTESYLELKFDFYNAINNPEKLRIAFGSTETEGSASLHYTVYFLDDSETIETTAKVYNYQVSTRQNGEHILALTDLGQIKSVVVRFYESESEALVISEIGLYGGEAELYISGSATSKDDDYTSVYGENLFKNASLTFSATDGTNVYDAENGVTLSRYTVITDNKSNLTTSTTSTYIQFAGLTSASNDYQQTAAYIDMTFAMNGDINNPEKILLAFTGGTANTFKPSMHYAIYASDSLDKLYNDESKIVYYQNATRQGVEHLHDIKAKNLEGIKYIGIRWYERMNAKILAFSEVALYGGEYQSDLSLAGSVFLNAPEELDNYDIQYRVSAADLAYDTITDMGMVAGFKFTLEEKNEGATVNKAWATENLKKGVAGSTKFYNSKLVGAENLYFHILNSGSKDELDDRSGYAIYAIGYVTFTDTRGREISLWSNTMTKSSKQISRTQARDYYEDEENSVAQQIAASNYADYNFSDGSINITKVREYVAEVNEAINSIYVSQADGDDINNTGSAESPFKTLDKAAENGKIIKVIGAYTLDGTERIGNADHAVTIKGADANAAINATTMVFDGDATIDNITLNFQGATQATESVGGVVYANCNAVTFGKGVTTTTAGTNYAYIYGGMYDNDGTTTDITVNGGEWYRIFGNTDKNSGTVSETNVTIGGNASVQEVFGASHYYDPDENAQGTFTLTVSKANVTVNGGNIVRVFGGGLGSKSTAVETNVTVNGGDGYGETEGYGMEVFGGGRVAGLKKSNVIINGGIVQQIFGGSQSRNASSGSNAEQLNSETNVYIYGGTITRRIYGGCYNNYEVLGGFTSTYHVYGKTYVFIDDNENLNLILDSDELDNGICAHSRVNVDDATYEQTAILEFATQAQYEKCLNKIGTICVPAADAYTELRIAGETQ